MLKKKKAKDVEKSGEPESVMEKLTNAYEVSGRDPYFVLSRDERQFLTNIVQKNLGLAMTVENNQAIGLMTRDSGSPSKTAIIRRAIPSLVETIALGEFWCEQNNPSDFVIDALHMVFVKYLESEMRGDDKYPIPLQLAARTRDTALGQNVAAVCSLYITWIRAKREQYRYHMREVEISGQNYRMAVCDESSDKLYDGDKSKMQLIISETIGLKIKDEKNGNS